LVPKETKTKLKWPLAIFDYFSHLKTPVSNCKTGMKFPNFIYITFKWKMLLVTDVDDFIHKVIIFRSWISIYEHFLFQQSTYYNRCVHHKYFLKHTQSWGSQPHQFMISWYKSRSEISNIWSATKGTDWLFYVH